MIVYNYTGMSSFVNKNIIKLPAVYDFRQGVIG